MISISLTSSDFADIEAGNPHIFDITPKTDRTNRVRESDETDNTYTTKVIVTSADIVS